MAILCLNVTRATLAFSLAKKQLVFMFFCEMPTHHTKFVGTHKRVVMTTWPEPVSGTLTRIATGWASSPLTELR